MTHAGGVRPGGLWPLHAPRHPYGVSRMCVSEPPRPPPSCPSRVPLSAATDLLSATTGSCACPRNVCVRRGEDGAGTRGALGELPELLPGPCAPACASSGVATGSSRDALGGHGVVYGGSRPWPAAPFRSHRLCTSSLVCPRDSRCHHVCTLR